MVDFRKMMTPEQRERFDRDQEYIAREHARHRRMSNADLVKYAQNCINNAEGPRKYPAPVPVYDNAVWHFVLPELIRRLEQTLFTSPEGLIEKVASMLALLVDHKRPYVDEGGSHSSLIYINPPLDEHGYPDTTNHRLTAAIDTSCAPQPEATGRAVAALLNAAPELLRLARLGKIVEDHCPEDGSSDLVEKLDAAGAFSRK